VAGFKNFVEHNVDVLKEVLSKLISSDAITSLVDVSPQEGKVIQVDNKKIGVYKDQFGSIHAVSATCTHMGCTVSFNQTEKSWDCPCHGARYSIDGTVLNGPADRDLEYLNVDVLATSKD
jgi:Rieske Fe-S protein